MGMTYLNPQLDSFTTTQLGNMYEMFLTFAFGVAAVSAFFAFGLLASTLMSIFFGQTAKGPATGPSVGSHLA